MGIESDALVGLWQRESITYPSGKTDSSALIYWMQAHNLYADIRIPYDFPPFRKNAKLDDLSWEEMLQLTQMAGFAGRIVLAGSEIRWTRKFDWQPDTGVDDVAQIEFEGLDLVEEGGACGGHQIWRRITPLHIPAFALELKDPTDGRDGFLVSMDSRFVYARSRSVSIDAASGLMELLVAYKDDEEHARSLFDAEVSYGVITNQGHWAIEKSTQPWRNGDLLFQPGNSLHEDTLAVQEQSRQGNMINRNWDVVARED